MFQQYFTSADASQQLNQLGTLAVISFEQRCEAPNELGIVPVGMDSLSGLPIEVIRYGASPVERGVSHECHWNITEDVMFVSTWIAEADCRDIEAATHRAYLSLYRVLSDKAFAHVFRIWNFIPNINSGSGDSEEYKKFCVGRSAAFSELGLAESDFPAASALGHHSKGAVIYLLASRSTQGEHYENPQQQSAYRYPRQYGPRSPSFARATRIRLNGRDEVFISGTASILGHETKAPGNLQQQLEITTDNIATLASYIDDAPQPMNAIRVYLRHAEDFEAARQFLTAKYPDENMNFLLADICRANLLVEIEAAFKGSTVV